MQSHASTSKLLPSPAARHVDADHLEAPQAGAPSTAHSPATMSSKAAGKARAVEDEVRQPKPPQTWEQILKSGVAGGIAACLAKTSVGRSAARNCRNFYWWKQAHPFSRSSARQSQDSLPDWLPAFREVFRFVRLHLSWQKDTPALISSSFARNRPLRFHGIHTYPGSWTGVFKAMNQVG